MRKRFPQANIRWVKGDAQEPPSDLGNYDHVVALGLVFCYVPHPEKAAKAMMDHLKPGGTIVIGVVNSEHLTESVARRTLPNGRVRNGFSCEELSELLLNAGFENARVKGHRFFIDGFPKEMNRALSVGDERRELIEDMIKIEQRMPDMLPAKSARQLCATAVRPA